MRTLLEQEILTSMSYIINISHYFLDTDNIPIKYRDGDYVPIALIENFFRGIPNTEWEEDVRTLNNYPVLCSRANNKNLPDNHSSFPYNAQRAYMDILIKLNSYLSNKGYNIKHLLCLKSDIRLNDSLSEIINSRFFNPSYIVEHIKSNYYVGKGYIGDSKNTIKYDTGLSNTGYNNSITLTPSVPLIVLAIRKDYVPEYYLSMLMSRELDMSNFILYVDNSVTDTKTKHRTVKNSLVKYILPVCMQSDIEIKFTDVLNELFIVPELPKTVSPLKIGEYFSKLLIESDLEPVVEDVKGAAEEKTYVINDNVGGLPSDTTPTGGEITAGIGIMEAIRRGYITIPPEPGGTWVFPSNPYVIYTSSGEVQLDAAIEEYSSGV